VKRNESEGVIINIKDVSACLLHRIGCDDSFVNHRKR